MIIIKKLIAMFLMYALPVSVYASESPVELNTASIKVIELPNEIDVPTSVYSNRIDSPTTYLAKPYAANSFEAKTFKAKKKGLIIWLASETGLQIAQHKLAQKIAYRSGDVWLLDLMEANYFPSVVSSMVRIPGVQIQQLIQYAMRDGYTKITLMGSGRAAVPLLRGLRLWQLEQKNRTKSVGLILISPKLYTETPQPGLVAKMLPIVQMSNMPIYLIQPRLSPGYWKVKNIVPSLQNHGSDVFTHILADVRDRFYFRPDASNNEDRYAQRFPNIIVNANKLLQSITLRQRMPVPGTLLSPDVQPVKTGHSLAFYKGDPNPPSVLFTTLENDALNLVDLRGKVLLINFWASWCPPCVKEIPSMQILKNKLNKQTFEILGVNIAESAAVIRQFLQKKLKVDFTILMDKDGEALKKWRVFAYPTSFILDKQGKIRYALYGSIEWDAPDIVYKLKQLAAE